jgi:hypothetical protein
MSTRAGHACARPALVTVALHTNDGTIAATQSPPREKSAQLSLILCASGAIRFRAMKSLLANAVPLLSSRGTCGQLMCVPLSDTRVPAARREDSLHDRACISRTQRISATRCTAIANLRAVLRTSRGTSHDVVPLAAPPPTYPRGCVRAAQCLRIHRQRRNTRSTVTTSVQQSHPCSHDPLAKSISWHPTASSDAR